MREGALYALFSLAAAIRGALGDVTDVSPRQKCLPSTGNTTIYDFTLPNVYQNETLDLSELRGKVTLFVNTATY